MPDDYQLKDDDLSAYEAVPPPLPAIAPAPPPLPAQALSYPSPWFQSRPGIITAIGVISIIVASLSGVSSVAQGFFSFGILRFSQATVAMKRARAASTTVIASPSGGVITQTGNGNASAEAVMPNGLGPDDRATIEQVLTSLQPLDEQRKAELNHYLARDGQSIFPTAGRAVTARQVRLGVSRSGTTADNGDDDPSHTYFVTGWGTLNVYDDKAVFTPRDRSLPTVTTSIAADSAAAGGGYGAVSNSQINQLVSVAQLMSNNAMDPGQVAAFRSALQNPQQQISPRFAVPSVQTAIAAPDGTVAITFTAGNTITIGPNGNSVTSSAYPPVTLPTFVFKGWLYAVVMIEAVLSTLLAIFLLVAGIQVMRQAPSGAWLHRLYVVIKIPLALIGGLAMIWMWIDFGAGIASASPQAGAAPAIQAVYATMSGMMTVASLIYPVALIFVLRSKSVQQYYNTVQ